MEHITLDPHVQNARYATLTEGPTPEKRHAKISRLPHAAQKTPPTTINLENFLMSASRGDCIEQTCFSASPGFGVVRRGCRSSLTKAQKHLCTAGPSIKAITAPLLQRLFYCIHPFNSTMSASREQKKKKI